MTTKRPLALIAIGLTGALAFTACAASDGSPASGGHTVTGTPVIQLATDPVNLDPHQTSGGRPMLRMAYDTLVAETTDGKIVSQLAESWETTPSQLVFTIKDGVTCSDGTELTAETVANNFRRIQDPAAGVPFTATFLGSTDYVVSSDAVANTVTIDLAKPFSPFLYNLTFFPPIVCQAALDDPALMQTGTYGTGPFQLADYTPGESYTFTARDGYEWGPDGLSTVGSDIPEEVILQVVNNETTAANMMLAGDLDAAFLVQPGAYERLADAGYLTRSAPNAAMFVHFNFLRDGSPVLDLGVRTALGQTVDRAAMSTIATGTPDQVSTNVALPQSMCDADMTGENLVQYAPEDAVAALEAAGWTKDGASWTKDGETLALNVIVTSSTGDTSGAIADYVAAQWTELGIDVTIEDLDQPTGLERRAENQYDVWVGAWTNVFNPATAAPYFMKVPSPNYAYFANEEYNALATEAFSRDLSEACAVWAQAQDAMDRHVSMIPLYYTAAQLVSADGLEFSPNRSFLEPATIRLG